MTVSNLLNASALAAGLAGASLNSLGWVGGQVLLPLGFGLLLASTLLFPAAANAKVGMPRLLSTLAVSTLAAGALSILFKLLHWQGTVVLGLAALLLAAALSGLLLSAKAAVVGSRELLTAVFVFFTLFFATLLLPGRPPAGAAGRRIERWPPAAGATARCAYPPLINPSPFLPLSSCYNSRKSPAATSTPSTCAVKLPSRK